MAMETAGRKWQTARCGRALCSLALASVAAFVLASPARASTSLQVAFSAQSASSGDNGVDAFNRMPFNGAGRFLHFTDLHPDKYYAPGARINDACHEMATPSGIISGADEDEADVEPGIDIEKRKKHKRKKPPKRAGYWGTPNSVCDAPEHLIRGTMEWLAREWQPSQNESSSARAFDFIIWTGDTARHDIDFMHPRKAEEIFDYNKRLMHLVEETFPSTPIVPNIGNNDIIPHNIMFPGPNSMTNAYLDVWSAHIPQDQRQVFLDGGYFVQEVIPGDLAVVSINTLYFYDANTATRGCKKRSEPGSIQLDWLAEELAALRARGMQAHIIGHVPPTAGNYYPACYSRYTDIALRYQDTIVGQHFGHMNIDAMFLQEDDYLVSEKLGSAQPSRQVSTSKELTLADDLRKDYDLVPTRQKTNLDAYLPFFVAPSMVPTYLPSVRVWTYNATRPANRTRSTRSTIDASPQNATTLYGLDSTSLIDEEMVRSALSVVTGVDALKTRHVDPLSRSHRRPNRSKKHRKRRQAPHVSPDSPSRRNTYLSMLGYSQWVLDLNWHNKQHNKRNASGDDGAPELLNYHLEYTTYDRDTLWGDYIDGRLPSHAHRPIPQQLLDREIQLRKASKPRLEPRSRVAALQARLPRFLTEAAPNEVEILKRHVSVPKALRPLTDYGLQSMTISSVLEWARALAADDDVWNRFVRRIYTESGAED